MNKLFFLILFLCFHSVQADEKIFSNKTLSNLYMNPSDNAPIIYPVELGKLMFIKDSNETWFKVLDKRTGLMGWVLKENYSLVVRCEYLQNVYKRPLQLFPIYHRTDLESCHEVIFQPEF